MRFLNTSTLQFEHIPDSELHLKEIKYAILSHRWGADKHEVSFEDVRLSTDFSDKKGFHKLKGFYKAASSANCRYGWVDTCCINKGDLSELNEAINSMYQWYQGSKICITYLEDVYQEQLTNSVWFDRGWTLQELISPKDITFFNHDWNILGTKSELIADLSRKTRIPEGILSHKVKLSTCSVAQRMSWGANRATTRVEDRAYSLMGLFDINMPMIYGEREKAFLRLQHNIIQRSKDESIFAWDMDFEGYTRTYSGLYAPSPLAYANCSGIFQIQGSPGISENNGELSMRVRTVPHSPETYLAMLHCSDRAHPDSAIAILIARTSVEGEYVRVAGAQNVIQWSSGFDLWHSFQERQIRVSVNPTEPPANIFNGFVLQTPQLPGHDGFQTTILSNSQTSKADHICPAEYNQGIAGVVLIESKDRFRSLGRSEDRWIAITFGKEFNPILWLTSLWDVRLQYVFRQAVASGFESSEHRHFMESFTGGPYGTGYRRIYFDHFSVKGEVITIDKRLGIDGQTVSLANLKIFVQLQLRGSPTLTSVGDVDDGGQLLNPMEIWAVKITTTGEKWAKSDKGCWFILGVYTVLTFASIVISIYIK